MVLQSQAAVGERTGFRRVEVENPSRRSNEIFPAFEAYHSPRMGELRSRYDLGSVVEEVGGEWERILALRHWIASKIEIEDVAPTPVQLETFAILDAALAGGRFHCTHFSIVQHAVLNSFGYVTRRLQAGSGHEETGRNHGINEVWVNELCKWVLVDAKYDLHFEKAGMPLSALEIRDEVWRDGGAAVAIVAGPERAPLASGAESTEWAKRVSTYRWCAWEIDTNRFTSYPATRSSALVVYDDEMFRANTWHRDGKPHWAYGTPYFIEIARRDWIEWTPGVISSRVVMEACRARISLSSFTPNLRTYQMRPGPADWEDCADRIDVSLVADRHELAFRTVNLFGVAGPVHRVVVERDGGGDRE